MPNLYYNLPLILCAAKKNQIFRNCITLISIYPTFFFNSTSALVTTFIPGWIYCLDGCLPHEERLGENNNQCSVGILSFVLNTWAIYFFQVFHTTHEAPFMEKGFDPLNQGISQGEEKVEKG
jgi:hypothetical protein